jgi:TATA-box binding protein (TBP) (component of TFIID and TFIIIB)
MDNIHNELTRQLQLEYLPPDIHITTITFCCKFNTLIKTIVIGNTLELDDTVLTIKNKFVCRSSIPIKKKKRRQINDNVIDLSKKNFFNQITLVISTPIKNINVKLFQNGSIQMTGCTCVEVICQALLILIDKLSAISIIDDKEVNYVSDRNGLHPNDITKLQISMINSSLRLGYQVNRNHFFNTLLLYNTQCTYDQLRHASLDITYPTTANVTKPLQIKNIHIFVFESGSVILTGAQNCKQISIGYTFLKKMLTIHQKYIQ